MNEVLTKPLNATEFKRVIFTYAGGNNAEKWGNVLTMTQKINNRHLETK